MNPSQIFVPVLVQILLTIAVFVGLSIVKVKAAKNGDVDENKRALHADAWPDYVLKFSNNIANQFETPVLFYALCFVLWAVKAVDMLTLGLAWGYVGTRVIHAYIHTGSNYVPARRRVFMLGCVFLLLMTVRAGLAIMGG
jgi:hypothetical protein